MRGGHRSVPHTADLRVEAWAPTREETLTQAIRGLVESFVDPSGGRPLHTTTAEIRAEEDEDLLAALMDDVVYRLDTADEVPVGARVAAVPGGLRVDYLMADATALPAVGAAPKAVTLHGLSLGRTRAGWSCSVTLDV
ncbi:archease [Streptomyces hoynatensis]|uniref:Archease n=1 Tax=Streptomyces hoynatensis TaxID=1141874 RepID=A0A3A9YLL9_9ACTN|nr:archease [Streptomyces hoynatensis]RKN37109.1 archease [Streptomyces hoynatensis]